MIDRYIVGHDNLSILNSAEGMNGLKYSSLEKVQKLEVC